MGIFDIFGGKPNIERLRERGDIAGLIRSLQHQSEDVQRQAARSLLEFDPEKVNRVFSQTSG